MSGFSDVGGPSQTSEGAPPGHSSHVILPISAYIKVFAALMVLLFVTVGAAFVDVGHIIPIPGLNIAIALTIAVIKAALVVLFFMHVKYGTRLTWLWAGAGFVWVTLMFGTVIDYIARTWIATGAPWH